MFRAFMILLLTATVTNAGDLLPPSGKTLVFITGTTQDESYKTFQNFAQQPSGLIVWENDVQGDGGGIVFQSQIENEALFVAWDFRKGHKLKEIAEGKYDDKVKYFGELMSCTKRPVYLNIGVEVDLPDDPGFADEYKAGHRYIKDMYDRLGFKNITYIMHMACHKNPSVQDIEKFYPGDNYVDMLCCSLYGAGNIAGAERLAGFAKRHKKVFGIAECGEFVAKPKDTNRDWNKYWKPFFTFVHKNDVRLMVYLGDEFPNMSPPVKENWKKEMAKPRYLLGGTDLYKSLNYDTEGNRPKK
jgi:hypothetical protein